MIGRLFPTAKVTGRPPSVTIRSIDSGDEQRVRYRGGYVVVRCFNKLKQWRGIAMRSDKTSRNHHSGLCLAATLHWFTGSVHRASTSAAWSSLARFNRAK